MTRDEQANKIAADLKAQEVEMEELQNRVTESKEASEALNKSLENLKAVTEKVEEEKG